jgi:hypothetical protein
MDCNTIFVAVVCCVCSMQLVRLLRYPSVQRPNDRQLFESEDTKEMKKLLVEDLCMREVDKVGRAPGKTMTTTVMINCVYGFVEWVHAFALCMF